jgi:seryl-tRNA synthetase
LKRQYEIIRADKIKNKLDDLHSLLQQIKDKNDEFIRKIKNIREDSVKELHQKKRKNEADLDISRKRKREDGVVEKVEEKGDFGIFDFSETIERALHSMIKGDKEKQNIDDRQSKW